MTTTADEGSSSPLLTVGTAVGTAGGTAGGHAVILPDAEPAPDPSVPAAGGARPRRRDRLRLPPRWVGATLLLYAATRALVGLTFLAVQTVGTSHLRPFLVRWDAIWYLNIAQFGYPHTVAAQYAPHHGNSLAFFPGYPLLVRATAALLGGHVTAAGYLDNLVLGAAAVLVLRVLFTDLARSSPLVRRRGEDPALVADRGAALFVTFPGAVILSLPYAEPLAILGAAVCLLALERRWWVVAGVAALVADATRPNVLGLAGACAVAAVLALWHDRHGAVRHWPWLSLTAPILAPAGTLAFFWWEDARTHIFLVWDVVEKMYWGQTLDFGTGLVQQLTLLRTRALTGDAAEVWIAITGLVLLAIGLGLLAWFRPPLTVWVYTLGVAASCVLSSAVGARPRFLLTAFPLFLGVAAVSRGAWHRALVTLGAGAGTLLLLLYLAPDHLVP